ncbi:MAG: T9SS type A sorting domain-containing protein, partial [Ignavibacteriae bacterium]|nr:T9SS type A sorting domain-containing protein [Ignavibacteriota bacterium]
MTSKVNLKLRFILLYLIAVSLTMGQTPFWKDLSGSPNFSLLNEGANGVLFATYGVFNTLASSEDGLYRSTNEGMSWTRTAISGQIDEFETNGKYLLTTRRPNFDYVRNYSTDNGSTWSSLIGTRGFFPYFHALSNSGGIYALDLGNPVQVIQCDLVLRRWRAIGTSLTLSTGEDPTALRVDNKLNFFVGTNRNGMYVSYDTGKTWNNVLQNKDVSVVYVSPTNNVFAGTALKDTNKGGVYFSSDTGKTWRLLGLTIKPILSLSSDSLGTIYAQTDKGLYQYSGSGTIWNFIGPKSASFDDMLVTKSNIILTSGAAEGLYRTTNAGTTWSKTITVRNENVAKICLDKSNKIYLGTWGNRIYSSNYNETGWTQLPDGTIGDEIHGFANADSFVYAATDRGLYRTSNHGTSWRNLTDSTFGGNAYCVAVAQSGMMYIGTNWGVYRSSNQGEDWMQAHLESTIVTTLAVNQFNDVFAGTDGDGLFRSTDNGMSWQYLGFSGQTISCLTINDAGNIYAGSYGGVHRSTDNGETWSYVSFVSTYVNALLPKGTNHLYAGTFSGVYSSSNGGETWAAMSNTGLRQTTILSLAFDENDNLIAGTYQGGLYRTEQSITDVTTEDELPTATTLFQNYPNPFNPSTTLSFVISHSSLVNLKIYNLLGQEVGVLVNNELYEAGEYALEWNAGKNPSGVYFARLEILPNSGSIHSKSIH